ncbi:MAG TPA: orotate phosphoribosyltransferase [Kofleriaceae bacterium]|nr:orotate phosphoribosyltransferase [Kofleriaceae bacterium]
MATNSSSTTALLPAVEPQRQRLLELLRRDAFEQKSITLSSGRTSNFYIDCRRVSLTAEGHFLIGQLMRAIIARVAPGAEAVGGLTLGADPLVSATSLMSFIAGQPLTGFLVRKEPKGHGTGQWLEGGGLRAGMATVILEDVITTGGSTIRAIERSRAAELEVVHVVVLVDRDEGGREAVEAHAPVTSLFTRHDFIQDDAPAGGRGKP